MSRLPTGSLVITVGKDGPRWEGKWRHEGRQIKRRLGKAWLDGITPNTPVTPVDPDSKENAGAEQRWVKRAGRAQEGFLSREDAIVAMRAMIAAHALQSAESGQESVPSFGAVAESWFERAVRRGLKPMTLKLYRQLLDAYILDKAVYRSKKIPRACPFTDKPMDLVNKDDMRGWFDPIEYSPQKAKLFMAVKSICAFAVSEEWARENVALTVECRVPQANGDYEFFDHSEIERLISAAADEHDAALYATAAFAGLRKGELFGLQWRDIDFDGKRLVVRRNLTLGQIGTPKNGQQRIVPLIPPLAERLREFKRKKLNPPSATVFYGHPDVAVKRYRAALRRAKLRPMVFHGLRHSFGSHAVTVATLVQVRNWMGHSDLRTTGRYLHAKSLDSDADLLAGGFR